MNVDILKSPQLFFVVWSGVCLLTLAPWLLKDPAREPQVFQNRQMILTVYLTGLFVFLCLQLRELERLKELESLRGLKKLLDWLGFRE